MAPARFKIRSSIRSLRGMCHGIEGVHLAVTEEAVVSTAASTIRFEGARWTRIKRVWRTVHRIGGAGDGRLYAALRHLAELAQDQCRHAGHVRGGHRSA